MLQPSTTVSNQTSAPKDTSDVRVEEALPRLPQLDGVRGLAVLIVVVGHLTVFDFGLGLKRLGAVPPIGVNLFFVLSGYLITGILLKTRKEPTYFLSFYGRRALRIWPLYWSVLLLCYALLNGWLFTFNPGVLRWPLFALLIQNLVYGKAAIALAPLVLASLWSIAVEEQFYLLWPTIVRFCSLRTLRLILLSLSVLAPLIRYIVLRSNGDAYTNPFCRFDGMADGGLVALWFYREEPSRDAIRRVLGWIGAGAVLLLLLSSLLHGGELLNKSATNLLFTGVLLAALRTKRVAGFFRSRALRYLGKISYGAYLLHIIVADVVLRYLPEQNLWVRLSRIVLVCLGTLLAASCSFQFLETPMLRLKRFFPVHQGKSTRPVLLKAALLLMVIGVSASCSFAQSPGPADWAGLQRFAQQNQILLRVQDPQRVVFMGDSITEHWIQYDPAFFANAHFVNRGIYGQITSQMLVRFGQDVLDLKPKTVVILAGTNDLAGNAGPESIPFIERQLESMVQLAQANHIQVVLSSILPVTDAFKVQTSHHSPELIKQLNSWMSSLCAREHCTFLDYTATVSDNSGQLRRDFTEDGLHPNVAAYRVMEPLVQRVLH